MKEYPPLALLAALLLGCLLCTTPIRAEVPATSGDFGFNTVHETSETLGMLFPIVRSAHRLPDGGLGVVFAARTFGTSYSQDSVSDVFFASSDPEGLRWSVPEAIKTYHIDGSERPVASEISTSGTLINIWSDFDCWADAGCGEPALEAPAAGSYFMVARSPDKGSSWEPTIRMSTNEEFLDNLTDPFGGSPLRLGTVCVNNSGSWVFLSSYLPGEYPPKSYGTHSDAYVLVSDDDGRTWGTPIVLPLPVAGVPLDEWYANVHGVSFLDSTRVLAILVEGEVGAFSTPRVTYSLSEDKGHSWRNLGPVDSSLESFYDSSANLFRLPGGRLLCRSLSVMSSGGADQDRYFIFSPDTMQWSPGFEIDLSSIPGYVGGDSRLNGLDCDDERCLALFIHSNGQSTYIAELDPSDLSLRRGARLESPYPELGTRGDTDNCVYTDGAGNWFLWLEVTTQFRPVWLHSYNLQPTNTGFMAR